MRRFEIHGWFEAENIQDAFGWLAQHFDALYGGEEEDFTRLCDLRVEPVEQTTALQS